MKNRIRKGVAKGMKKYLLFVSLLLCIVLIGCPLLSSANTFDPDTQTTITEHTVFDSITVNGITVEAYYTPKSEVANYDTDTTYCCAALVKRFYQQVYGVTVTGLYSPSSVPVVSEGSFITTTDPQVGDIVRFNNTTHWALVKSIAANGDLTLIEQNVWVNNGTDAIKGRVISPSEDDFAQNYTFFHYSQATAHVHQYTKQYEAEHPHQYHMICACGNEYMLDEYAAPVTCETCYQEKNKGMVEKVAIKAKSTKILVNGKSVTLDAYNISDNNYFKLRDIAKCLNGTEKNFEISWDNDKKALNITPGKKYTIPKDDAQVTVSSKPQTAVLANAKLYLNNERIYLAAYNINNNNYFKLQDIGRALDMKVGWDNTKKLISLDTTKAYADK